MPPAARRPQGLPVEESFSALGHALNHDTMAVLRAPPGAGKTTLVPLALVDARWLGSSRIVMLEPRRLAARAAARRMAQLLGEVVGETVGYRVRLDTQVGPATRIEVVTEGVLTRLLLADPTLEGYGLVIFDEFHERSLHADLGLALALHTKRLVRPDLRILVMSATLEGAAIARLLDDAPIVASEGRQYPVETRYASTRPVGKIEPAVARSVRDALERDRGDILAFLPGAAEIRRVAELLLAEPLPAGTNIVPLFGMLPTAEQDAAIAPSPPGRRKVVLATSIAETSLTIDGVRVVIDCGLARAPRFSPRTGMARLHTSRVSRAAADQRRGRAGRQSSGVCYRLWPENEDAQLLAATPPEILDTDLVPLALDLAMAGIPDPLALSWLDPPPAGAFAQARELLTQLTALDARGHLTTHGRRMAQLGMHPRFAHMVLTAAAVRLGALACDLASLLQERDPLRGGLETSQSDIRLRLDMLRGTGQAPGSLALRHIRTQSDQWRRAVGARASDFDRDSAGRILALAYPDRVAHRRPGARPRYVMRNRLGVQLTDGDALSAEPYLVIAESDGRAPESRVFLAAPLASADLETDFAGQIVTEDRVAWDDASGRVIAHRERRLGAIVLDRAPLRDPDADAVRLAVADAVRRRGISVLPWSAAAMALRQRLGFLHHHDPSWPDVGDDALIQSLVEALAPELARVRSVGDLRRVDVHRGLLSMLSGEQRARLDRLAPTHLDVPSGSRVPIDYTSAQSPTVAVRLQELFGCATTPTILEGRVPVTLELLSPAHRPVQVTRDLAGFWRTSYFDVRRDLRGRYPKHPWPDDPLTAAPTARARPRR
jgi:ATP-dependent helicase HrpB